MESFVNDAIKVTTYGQKAFCKFLAANDTDPKQSHQAGIYIPKNACSILFDHPCEKGENQSRTVFVKWFYETELYTESKFIYYGKAKNEYRMTRTPVFKSEYTGALFVLVQSTYEEYQAFVLNTDDEIEQFLDAFGLSPSDTNRLIDKSAVAPASQELLLINQFIEDLDRLGIDFPESKKMSDAARTICDAVYDHAEFAVSAPDKKLVDWTTVEYNVFKALEYSRYGHVLKCGFSSVDDFINVANQVLNRRKSRAGKSLEHHLTEIFKINHLGFETQVVTEGNKKPDFIFPSGAAYQLARKNEFSKSKLIFLAAKTTCKDRWRQILNEADLLRNERKYLCTLQQGVSENQMEEMQKENVTLVVPEQYIVTYPRQCREQIWSLKRFVDYVKETQR